jgi:hypothetical protein
MPPLTGDDDGTTGYAVYGSSRRGGYSLVGDSDSNYGVYGTSISNYGVYGSGYPAGVYGWSPTSYGVIGESSGASGVAGYGSGYSTGVYGYSVSGHGVYGFSHSRYSYSAGVYGYSIDTIGVSGESRTGYGVYAHSKEGYGLYASGYEGYAAYLKGEVNIHGPVHISGPLYMHGPIYKSGGSFKIDHPLDPANKFLSHSFVESPDMKNVYDSVAVLDDKGEAEIELPDWFGALNKDFRYQLTAIGAPAPNLHIAEEIFDGDTNYSNSNSNHNSSRFKIAGGTSGMKVSWQVTGIRQDPWANVNRIQVEEDKPANERGYYLHPDLYGQPAENGINHLLFPEEEKWQEQLIK